MMTPRSAAMMFALMMSTSAVFASPANDSAMKRLATQAGCLTCHSIEAKPGGGTPIGPAWADVARKYRGQTAAVDTLTRTVQQGSNPYQSHWKNKANGLAMPPNAVAINEADTRKLVTWILALDQ